LFKASLVGRKYGKVKLHSRTNKSFAGLFAFVAVMICGMSLISWLIDDHIPLSKLINVSVATGNYDE
jgi:dolichol kinase